MSVLVDLQPFVPAGLKLSKTMIKAAIRAKASPAVAAVAALELLVAAAEQTGTYLPQFLKDVGDELHFVNQERLKAANHDNQPTPQTEETLT